MSSHIELASPVYGGGLHYNIKMAHTAAHLQPLIEGRAVHTDAARHLRQHSIHQIVLADVFALEHGDAIGVDVLASSLYLRIIGFSSRGWSAPSSRRPRRIEALLDRSRYIAFPMAIGSPSATAFFSGISPWWLRAIPEHAGTRSSQHRCLGQVDPLSCCMRTAGLTRAAVTPALSDGTRSAPAVARHKARSSEDDRGIDLALRMVVGVGPPSAPSSPRNKRPKHHHPHREEEPHHHRRRQQTTSAVHARSSHTANLGNSLADVTFS